MSTVVENKDLAVIETGGKQYLVKEGTIIDIEKLDSESGSSVLFDKVLLVKKGDSTQIGQPYLEDTSVKATILNQSKDDKVIVFKFKRKTGYKLTKGHRQNLTTIKVESIGNEKPSKKADVVKKETK